MGQSAGKQNYFQRSQPLTCWKMVGFNFQSDQSFMALDSLSARVLSTPRRCWAFKRMFLSMHHSSLARQFSCGDIPPRLLMYVSVDMLSIFSKMVRLLELTSVLGKAFYCQVSCQELQAVDVHLLFMGAPWTSVPNPIYNSQQTNLFV